VNESYWFPFIKSLPTPVQTSQHPWFWPSNSTAELQDSSLEKALHNFRSVVDGTFDRVEQISAARPDLLPPAMVNISIWRWAMVMVATRGYTGYDLEEATFIPHLDGFNHRPGASILRFDKGAGVMQLLATRSHMQDQQVFVDYGLLGNFDLLAQYGFTLASNLFSIVFVLQQLNPKQPKQFYISNFGPSSQLLDAMKNVALHGKLNTSNSASAQVCGALCYAHAMTLLEQVCQDQLSRMGPAKRDRELLKHSLGAHLQTAVLYRLHRKEALARCSAAARAVVKQGADKSSIIHTLFITEWFSDLHDKTKCQNSCDSCCAGAAAVRAEAMLDASCAMHMVIKSGTATLLSGDKGALSRFPHLFDAHALADVPQAKGMPAALYVEAKRLLSGDSQSRSDAVLALIMATQLDPNFTIARNLLKLVRSNHDGYQRQLHAHWGGCNIGNSFNLPAL